jgi:DnaJ-class molecular chaperone
MMAKLIISYKPRPADVRAALPCASCSGSGRYDSWDVKRDRPIVCGACNGTGKEHN